jgi:hypothetical protein
MLPELMTFFVNICSVGASLSTNHKKNGSITRSSFAARDTRFRPNKAASP